MKPDELFQGWLNSQPALAEIDENAVAWLREAFLAGGSCALIDVIAILVTKHNKNPLMVTLLQEIQKSLGLETHKTPKQDYQNN